jgi:uncharacterized cupin superfamily protein
MQRTMVDGIAMWSRWQPDRNVYFNSHFVYGGSENVLVDPLPLDDADAAEIAAQGGAQWIVITNRDHERAAGDAARRFGAKIAASEPDVGAMSVQADRILRDDDLIAGIRVIGLEGLKTAGEFALWMRTTRALIVGDALWGDPAGSLRMLPDEKLADPMRAVQSLRQLRVVYPRHLLVGDGAPIFDRAYEAITAYLETRGTAHPNVVNLDELTYWNRNGPGVYRAGEAEIGFLLGAEKLGYRVARLDPGNAFCPMHWHTEEEELFIVWDGAPTLETPHGSKTLRRGDLIAFPTREFGAHKLVNRSDVPASVLMISNTKSAACEVCFYPDSKKLLVDATDLIVRSEPALDYYDGETEHT